MGRPKLDNPMVNVSLKLPPEIAQKIDSIAYTWDRPQSYIVRKLALRGFADYMADGKLETEPIIRFVEVLIVDALGYVPSVIGNIGCVKLPFPDWQLNHAQHPIALHVTGRAKSDYAVQGGTMILVDDCIRDDAENFEYEYVLVRHEYSGLFVGKWEKNGDSINLIINNHFRNKESPARVIWDDQNYVVCLGKYISHFPVPDNIPFSNNTPIQDEVLKFRQNKLLKTG